MAFTPLDRSSVTWSTFMISGPVVVQVLEGENAVARNREVMGATNPKKAEFGTIRASLRKALRRTRSTVRTALKTPLWKLRSFSAGLSWWDEDWLHGLGGTPGRILMSAIFIQSGISKAMAPAATMAFFTKDGVVMPGAAYAVALLIEIGGGILFLVGWACTAHGACAWYLVHSDSDGRPLSSG